MPKSQKEIDEAKLRAIYVELWPLRQADHWRPSAGDLVVCEHVRRQMDGMKEEMDRLRSRLANHVSARECA